MTPKDLKQIDELLQKRVKGFVTKDEIEQLATKDDLKFLASKQDFQQLEVKMNEGLDKLEEHIKNELGKTEVALVKILESKVGRLEISKLEKRLSKLEDN